jgi:hypothetical protein
MIKNFEEFSKNNFDKLKSRARKGIPDCLRGYVWQHLGKVNIYLEKNPGLYITYLNDEKINTEDEAIILRDIDRTFPKHSFFKDKYGLGLVLFNQGSVRFIMFSGPTRSTIQKLGMYKAWDSFPPCF